MTDALTDDASVGSPPSGAPPVVAVVVTHDPGPWLEDALQALGEQDYPNLSVLVLDAASEADPTARIAAVLPSAYVRRLDGNEGFGPTANDVLNVVEGASHFLLLHDDAAPEPDAVRLMVEEAYRSNAGVVAPKLVTWDDPRRLLAVGASADKSGHVAPYGRGELDQEQHDAVRDVFVAPGGCQLVRADLFATLGGYSPSIPLIGEDLDLSWRAQVAGARVVVAPGARVRHLEATVAGERHGAPGAAELARLATRHRLRAVLTSYQALHLLRVLPQVVVVMVVEALFGGRQGLAVLADAWRWNLGALGEVRRARRQLRAVRLVKDADVRRLHTRNLGRLGAAIRGGLAVEERTFGVGAASRQFARVLDRGGLRLTVAVWLGLAAVLVLGSRHLIGRIPAVGQFAPLPAAPWELVRLFVAGWHPAGVGTDAAPPFAFLSLGALGTLLLGAEDLAQKLLVLGAIPVGIVGIHRLTAALASWRPRLVAAVLYAAVPLPYDAFARGRWSTLVGFAAMPYLMARLLRATGVAPFGAPPEDEGEPGRRALRRRPTRTPADAVEALLGAEAGSLDQVDTEELRVAAIAVAGRHDANEHAVIRTEPPAAVRHPGTFLHQAAPAAVLVALAVSLSPPVTLAFLVAGVAVAAGFALVGPARAGVNALALAGAATVGAALLLTPWTFELLAPGSPWSGVAGFGPTRADAPGFGEVVRFLGAPPFGMLTVGLLVAAVLPLAVGRRWRAEWAARLWVVATVSWVVAWAAGRGWLLVDPPAVDVLLLPAAVAVVLAAALGLSAFELDLPGYRFGWRQAASLVAAAAGLVATLPTLAAAVDGRWRMPARDFAGSLSWMPEQVDEGDFRVLWVGAPDALPLDGWRLDDGLAYGSSRNGVPDVTSLWPGTDAGANGLLADALGVARRAETTRVGALLAPLGVRYVAVPRANAPAGQDAEGGPPPQALLDGLRGQVDLRLVPSDDALVLFENAAWRPIRHANGQPVLEPGSSVLRSSGPVPAGEVRVAESYSARWQLTVGDAAAGHAKADDWANSFTVPRAGDAVLRYRTPALRIALLVVEALLWAFAVRWCVLAVRARRAALRPRDGEGR